MGTQIVASVIYAHHLFINVVHVVSTSKSRPLSYNKASDWSETLVCMSFFTPLQLIPMEITYIYIYKYGNSLAAIIMLLGIIIGVMI